jgi:hypothetical protein
MAHRYRELSLDNDICNYEEEDALEWKHPTPINPKKEETIEDRGSIPDAVWLVSRYLQFS